MDVVILIGRILFAMVFLGSAMGHLTKTKDMAAYAQARGLPMPEIAVLASGVLLVVGGLMVALGLWADLGALLLLAFLLPTAVLMHPFWKETDPQNQQMEMVHFMKDISLGGAALALFGFFAGHEELGLTITGPLFTL